MHCCCYSNACYNSKALLYTTAYYTGDYKEAKNVQSLQIDAKVRVCTGEQLENNNILYPFIPNDLHNMFVYNEFYNYFINTISNE